MRALRLSLVGALALVLLGGLSGAIAAQSEDEPLPATEVTGSITDYDAQSLVGVDPEDLGRFSQRRGVVEWPVALHANGRGYGAIVGTSSSARALRSARTSRV